jgi:topoisomerase-4 subunit A
VIRVAEKVFVGKNVLYINVFKKNDSRTIYNVVYRDGKKGFCFMKRFNMTSMIRDREYDVTQGTPGSRIMYFSANPNGEAEVIKVTLDPNPKIKKTIFDKDFSEISIKGRTSKGNLLTKFSVYRIGLKSRGHSTLGGRKVWYDPDVKRLNYDEHGQLLGEFFDEDQILVVLKNGEYYLSNFDENNHYEDNILLIEKYDPDKIWTGILYDADNQGYPYMKRFQMDANKKKQNWISENPVSQSILLTDTPYPRIQVTYGGDDAFRGSEEIDAEQFIAVKGYKAKGKRLTTYTIESITELEPIRFPEPTEEPEVPEPEEQDESEEAEAETPQVEPKAPGTENVKEVRELSLFDDED